MATGLGLVKIARAHINEKYEHVTVPKDDPNWRGPWDCSEFITWLVFQEARVLYGCLDNKGDPHTEKAYTGYWKRDLNLGIGVAVAKAAATPGGILLRYPPVPHAMGHIVLSDGRGGTIEAKGKAYGVGTGKVQGRTWHAGILLPEIVYESTDEPVEVTGPLHSFTLNAPNMSASIVSRIQQALKAEGFDPGEVNGAFGQQTLEAVVAFQDARGLVVDGEVGDETADALGIGLEPPEQILPIIARTLPNVPNVVRPETMFPLVPIAIQLLPELLNLIGGDKGAPLKDVINTLVSDITGTNDLAAAQQKIDSDPATATNLKVQLIKIAADQANKIREAQAAELKEQRDADFARLKANQDQQLSILKAQQDQADKARTDQFEKLKQDLQDREDARSKFYDAAKTGSPAIWAPIVISLIVTLGFFGVFILLIVGGFAFKPEDGNYQLINLTLGALVAAFTTVVSFWLGSSQGSRLKDAANADLQATQSKDLNETIKSQATTIKETQSFSLDAVKQASLNQKIDKTKPTAKQKPLNFEKCVDIVFSIEGKFSDLKDDPGGATNFGITQRTLSAWLEERNLPAATVDDVKNLSRETAAEIYRVNYWNKLRCDDLSPGVDLVTFDCGVNPGPGRGAKFLQAAVGAEGDGSVGSATIAAANVKDPQTIIQKMSDLRLDYYRLLSDFPKFGKGWTNRTNEVRKAAMAMAETVEV